MRTRIRRTWSALTKLAAIGRASFFKFLHDRLVRIEEHAWCPRCGHRLGKLQYREAQGKGQIVHTCLVCGAEFAEAPLTEGYR